MLTKILQFELRSQFRKPLLYVYFSAVLIFTIGSFATGSIPLGEKEHINAPFIIALWSAVISMVMALIGSSVMGLPMYRDIEYQTKDYYLTYPITPTGYFWGRFLGAFICMLFIAAAMPAGIYLGSKLGPLAGWKNIKQYGPNHLTYYLSPFFTIALPNLFFSSSLFFGLVSLTRNEKVIYSGGVLLFLGYFISFFFLLNDHDTTVVNLADPFAINGIILQSDYATSLQKNTILIDLHGPFLLNRVIWPVTGLCILLFAYYKFSFEAYFKSIPGKTTTGPESEDGQPTSIPPTDISFAKPYNARIFSRLVKIELLNLLRDNYFWIILTSGLFFLMLSFWLGISPFGVPELPRTLLLFNIFNDTFPFYIFLFILFYTGEIIHRDRATGFAAIGDALPPPDWIFNGSKLTTLLLLGISMAIVPALSAFGVQIAKGFYQFNFDIYAVQLFILLIPRLMAVVVFCYVIHVLINQKFAAHSIAVFVWVGLFFLRRSGILNYHLLLYSYTPTYQVSDMEGLGHMLKPIAWFNVYWLICAGLLVILAALFYHRGVNSSFKDRLKLSSRRFDAKTRLTTGVLTIAFLAVGGFIYYNVSYLNNYLTSRELEGRKVTYEKTLKPYDNLPLPKVKRIQLFADLYPEKQQESTRALVTIANMTDKPIAQLLFDGDDLGDYTIKLNGRSLPFTYPLIYHRGGFNWFRPEREPAEFRLYQFLQPLSPGDSLELEVSSSTVYDGFSNDVYGQNLLHNGTLFTGGLPSLGYDEGDELTDPYERKKAHLPEKPDVVIAQDNPAGFNTLKAGPTAYLFNLEVTVSTDGDQTAIAPGTLKRQWKQNGRNYFYYCQSTPGTYMPFHIISARYQILHDTVNLDHPVNVDIFYHPQHSGNINRFMAAYKDGLHYFNSAFGRYPFNDIRLAETNIYQNKISTIATLTGYSEDFAWNANFDNPNQFDYCYFRTARSLAQQWWRFQVAPNNTIGSLIIPEGLATYSALMVAERKYGAQNMRGILQGQASEYLFRRTRLEEVEHPLATMNQPYQDGKAGVVLYGLKDLIGEDSINAALRDFKNAYAFKDKPPFAGNNDLYRYLQKHVPDSLKYYLIDNWERVTLYDNKVTGVTVSPTANKNEYKVMLTVNIAKLSTDDNDNVASARYVNDYIEVGVFASDSYNSDGRSQVNPLYLKKYKLTAGQHSITVIVKGKPAYIGIDPYATLIDINGNDNLKGVVY